MSTKRCTKCQESRPSSEFSPDVRRKDGLRSRCRPCDREDKKVRRRKAPDLKFWTDAQLAVLLSRYNDLSDADLAELIGRSETAVQSKLKKLGLVRTFRVNATRESSVCSDRDLVLEEVYNRIVDFNFTESQVESVKRNIQVEIRRRTDKWWSSHSNQWSVDRWVSEFAPWISARAA